jgi:CDP-diacylglycerol--glycerol-3-phosphate 3-phosphatidyltransferase
MNQEHIIIQCPHCEDFILIEELNCCIFRHGVLIKTGLQIDPHAPKELCDFYASLFNLVTDFSFSVKTDGSTEFNNKKQIHPYLGNYKRFSDEFSKRMNTLFKEYSSSYADLSESKMESKAYIIPLIQNGCVNLNQDKEFTNKIFTLASQFSRVYLATGYFNLTKSYMQSILENRAEYKVLTAAPIANGFYQSNHTRLLRSKYYSRK